MEFGKHVYDWLDVKVSTNYTSKEGVGSRGDSYRLEAGPKFKYKLDSQVYLKTDIEPSIYYNLIKNDWWVCGDEIFKFKLADLKVTIGCDSFLIDKYLIFNKEQISACPLLQ